LNDESELVCYFIGYLPTLRQLQVLFSVERSVNIFMWGGGVGKDVKEGLIGCGRFNDAVSTAVIRWEDGHEWVEKKNLAARRRGSIFARRCQ
jgi:hypothetical protein